jgi:ornithine carbamoyltransferase
VIRHFTTIEQVSDSDLSAIYSLALSPFDDTTLQGQGVALVFERPSLRTRASSSTAVSELGGFATFFSDEEIGLDSRESAEDVGRTLSQMYSILAARVRHHEVFSRIARVTEDRMSLINLLSDVAHPTQAVADVLQVAYVGDATNVTRSLAVALLRLGVDVTVGAPTGYQLKPGGLEDPSAVTGGGTLRLSDSARDAVAGVDAVYTDAWVSMGFEEETARRRIDLASFRVTSELMAEASDSAVLLHCLPAHRGDEITDEVLDSSASLVWRQVFHRRSAMLGVLRWIKEEI